VPPEPLIRNKDHCSLERERESKRAREQESEREREEENAREREGGVGVC